MYRIFLYFCDCDPDWVDLGYMELYDTSLIPVFLKKLASEGFIEENEAIDPNEHVFRDICQFVIDLCDYSSLHSIYKYHNDRIEVFHV